jgi:predicted methyltransferase
MSAKRSHAHLSYDDDGDSEDCDDTPVAGTAIGATTAVPSGATDVVAVALDHGADRVRVGADGSVDVSRDPITRVATVSDTVSSMAVPQPFELPRLHGSSRLEIDFVAHVGEMLHLCGLISEPLTMRSLAGWLVAGKAALLTDAKFQLHGPLKDFLVEYDPAIYHGANDVERDVAKTFKLTSAYPEAIVMRVRVATVPLPPFANDLVSIVHVPRTVHTKMVPNMAKALAEFVPEPFKSSLVAYNAPTNPVAKMMVHELLMEMDNEYKQAVIDLRSLIGDEATVVRILNCRGATQRLGVLVEFVRRALGPPYHVKNIREFMCDGLVAKLDDPDVVFQLFDRLMAPPYNIQSLQTFVCDGVAAKFSDTDALFSILDRLMAPPFCVKSLQTFVCGGVAAKFSDPDALFSILDRLMAPPYNVKSLQTFVCDGVAAKFSDTDALFSILDRLMAPPFCVKSLQTFVGGGVAAKFSDPGALFSILDRLVAPPYNVKSLQTFVCNSVAATFSDPSALFSILGRLVAPPYNVRSLQTFVCDGIAAKFSDPDTLFTILDRLMAPPYYIKSLQTFVCDGIAAKFSDPGALFSILDRLMAPPYNVKSLQTFVCDGVAAKFSDTDALFSILDRLMAPPFCVKSLQTFVGNGVAAKFSDPGALFSILDRLMAPPYNVKSLQTFVCDGLAAKFDDPDRLFVAFDRLREPLGQTAMSIVSNNGAFASRLYNVGFIDHTLSIAAHMRQIGADVHASMMLMFDKNNCKLMDKVEALETKLKTFGNRWEFTSFIGRYKFDRRDKGRSIYLAAVAEL